MCTLYELADPFPVSEHTLCYFVAFLENKRLASQKILLYLSVVRSMQLEMGLLDPRDQSSLPVLGRVQVGIRRASMLRGRGPRRIRLPVTLAMLWPSIRSSLNTSADKDREITWAVASLTFFGFFCLGELLLERYAAYSPAVHLSWGHVAVNSHENPTAVRIHLKQSKCDQFGWEADVIVGWTNDNLCLVAAILTYFTERGGTPNPLFTNKQCRPLTKVRSVARIRALLEIAGYPSAQFVGHSFRIGLTMAAAQAGLEDSSTQALGRWTVQHSWYTSEHLQPSWQPPQLELHQK